ncbi:hypothetical protein [Thiomicrospira sp. XS5]|uniref:hypothetical protein n=1 Tax=Thiomicrospira sp. XS5 TaxID=1775636 RepID=UPI00128F5796|nr:hypothetical protein [Thiomicrospira sp. XS5]
MFLRSRCKALVVTASFSLLLSACGGGGGSSSSGSTLPTPSDPDTSTQTVLGKVVDPAIENAIVKMCRIDSPSMCLTQKTLTNAVGGYSLQVPGDTDLTAHSIVSIGGSDTETGESLGRMALSSPLAFSENGMLYVTPVTTLVSNYMMSQSVDVETARAAIASQLNLSESILDDSTESSASLMKTGLMLTQVGLNRTEGLSGLTVNNGDLDALIDSQVSDATVRAKLKETNRYIQAATTVSGAVNAFVVHKAVLESAFLNSADLSDATTSSNAEKITEKVLQILSDNGVSQANRAQAQLILSKLDSSLDVTDAGMTIPEPDLSGVNLAAVVVDNLLNNEQPLAEALSGDSDSKRAYYFASSASYLAQSETIVADVTDVDTMEDVYVALAEAYLKNGEPELALQYANRKLFKPISEAEISEAIASHYIDNNEELETAEALLDKGLELLKSYLESKGYASVKSSDMVLFRNYYVDYTKLGATAKAEAVTAYMLSMVDGFGDNSTPFMAYVFGLTEAAEAYADNGQIALARSTLQTAYDIALQTPPNKKATYPDTPSKWYYQIKIYSMAAIMDVYYWHLNDAGQALSLADEIKSIRANDGIAGNIKTSGGIDYDATVYYTDSKVSNNIIPILADYGYSKADISEVIGTIGRDTYIANGWANYAKAYAKTDIDGALQIISDEMTASVFGSDYSRDVVKALTYNGVAKDTDYMAQYLIDGGYNASALKAIDAAKVALDQAVSEGIESAATASTSYSDRARYYVNYGYAKLANLYYFAGAPESTVNETMDLAVAIATNADNAPENAKVSEPYHQAYALTYIARHYLQMGMTDKGIEYAEMALEYAEKIEDLANREKRLATLATILNDEGYSTLAVSTKVTDAIYALATGTAMVVSDSAQEDYVARAEILGGSYNSSLHAFTSNLAYNYVEVNNPAKAQNAVNALIGVAGNIANEDDRIKFYKAVVYGYALLNQVELAKSFAVTNIPKAVHNAHYLDSLVILSTALADYDAFETCEVATVDFDEDGKPDFYDYGATNDQIAACGLTLDDDSDGDGVIDSNDLTPFYAGSY